MKKLRVFEAFAGYGSQSIALENIGVPHDVVAISEIDADVTISYGAIRGDITKDIELSDEEIKEWLMSRNVGWDFQKQKSSIPRMKKDKLHKLYNACLLSNNLGDVSKINPSDIPDHDLFTYSFPCTDISVAGQMKGLEKGSGTRSGLLWECEKIIAAKKPKYLLMENVKNLVGKKFKAEFDTWCDYLETLGYKNFYQVLNAKDYGVPQNRERVFMISILDENATYEFPEKFPLELRLKDILEDVVDEKYYIDNEASNRLLDTLKNKVEEEIKLQSIGNVNPSGNGMNGNVVNSDGLAATVTTNKGEGQKIVCEQRCDEGLRFFKGDVCGTIRTIEAGGDKRVIECGAIRGRYEEDGSIVQKLELNGEDNTNTITTVQKDNMLLEKNNVNDQIKVVDIGYIPYPNSDKKHQSNTIISEEGLCSTIDTCTGGNRQPKTYSNYRIRKLTFEDTLSMFVITSELNLIMNERLDIYGTENERNSRDLLFMLWEEIGKKAIQWKTRRFDQVQREEVLQCGVYENGQNKHWGERIKLEQQSHNFKKDKRFNITEIRMRDMWENWKIRYSPQGFELPEQHIGELDVFMQELSHEDTQTKEAMCDMWGTDEGTGVLQQALSSFQEIWRSIMEEDKERVMRICDTNELTKIFIQNLYKTTEENRYRIRKLTPLCCWRLMGMKDEHFERCVRAGISNSQLYKQAGNSIVVDVLEYIFKELFKEYIVE